MRKFAIFNSSKSDINGNIIEKLPSDSEITIFTMSDEFKCDSDGVKVVVIPNELRDSNSKMRNYISKHYINEGFKGFLHVLEDRVQILREPTAFLDEIEKMMVMLEQKSWYNTETDPCNYTFFKYNPRFSVQIDEENAKKIYDKKIVFTSHANTSWVCFDLNTAEYSDIELDENFTVAMFYIIKFLAERRNNKKNGEIYYMNFYPTIEEEHGVFKLTKCEPYVKEKTQEETNELMGKENVIFESMKINHDADGSIEQIMDDIYSTLMKKVEKSI